MKITLHGDSGEMVDIEVPPAIDTNSYFAVSPHKCGSLLYQRIVEDLAREAGYPFLNIHSQIFSQGFPVKPFRPAVEMLLRLPGYCFTSLRAPWTNNIGYLAGHQKAFLVRDPRDALVSYYFSMTKSHPVPEGGPLREHLLSSRQEIQSEDIGQFIERRGGFFILENMQQFLRWSRELPGSHVFRYEDVIFDKETWITRISEIFNMKVPARKIKEIAARHDIIPNDENPNRHIRQVRPGNHKIHLSREHITLVEKSFPELFEAFSY